ncbi:SCP-like extracellular protein [Bacillus sp. C11]|nr:CAP domain-containing protein [Neobacillus terrae]NHM31579.1 SCP-like extracellular protein [Neobacillus terrae]
MLNISSMETDMNSNKYPHTRAVLIQMAKYQFIPFTLGQAGELPQGLGQQQRPSVSVPRVQQGTPSQQPAPQQGPTAQPAPQQGPTGPQQGPTAQRPTQQQKPAAQAPAQSKTQTTQGISQFAQQVIDLTNAQRKQNGLPALKADTQLSGVAQKKAVDMEKNHYFSHTSPTYGSPFDMMRDFGVTYSSAGENIAMGQKTPQEVVNAWMNSPGHRANILNRSFTNIGVGFDQNGNYWSQMFIGK